MSPPCCLCIFPGCHSVQSNGTISLFKFCTEYNIRKRWIDFVKRSYCRAFKITTNTRLCRVHFTLDTYSNCHQVKSGFLKSPWCWLVGPNQLSPSLACILPSRRRRVPPSPEQAHHRPSPSQALPSRPPAGSSASNQHAPSLSQQREVLVFQWFWDLILYT